MAGRPNERRRSQRHDVQMQVVLRSTDEAGRDFFDRSEIVSIDQHGARLRTRFRLKVGTEFELQLPGTNTPKRLRVIWRGDAGSFEAGLMGAEFVDPNDSWDDRILQAAL
jgi:hypothetical protein